MGTVNLLTKKCNSLTELENYFNNFSENHEIINKEIKIISLGNTLIYFLILEY